MKISGIIVLCGIGVVTGCTGALQAINEDLKKANEALAAPKGSLTAIETIGASSGFQVRNVSIPVPDLSCESRRFDHTRDAYVGGFKRAYIETWNAGIEPYRLSSLTAQSAGGKRRRDYFSSHVMEWSKDAQDAMYEYDIKTSRVTSDLGRDGGSVGERSLRASCVRSAYYKGRVAGRRQAQDDVRVVIERAPNA